MVYDWSGAVCCLDSSPFAIGFSQNRHIVLGVWRVIWGFVRTSGCMMRGASILRWRDIRFLLWNREEIAGYRQTCYIGDSSQQPPVVVNLLALLVLDGTSAPFSMYGVTYLISWLPSSLLFVLLHASFSGCRMGVWIECKGCPDTLFHSLYLFHSKCQ